MADGDRDYWMTAQEALEYGLVDKIHEINWDK
jgi:ATP-dependent protease ClpP protease subunit